MGANSFYVKYTKRLLDFAIGTGIIGILWPVMLFIAATIYIEDPGPVIFRQKRIGKGGQEFTMMKFRTMKQNAEFTGSGVYSEKGDPRVLKTGKILRKLSLDELIQAVHLIKGEMSLIGPRPPLTYHPWPIEEYDEEQLHMFDVRPGMTGWAQIHGRKAVEWHKRIEMNVWYSRNASFALDMKIFFATFAKLFSAEDNVNVGATIEKKEPDPC